MRAEVQKEYYSVEQCRNNPKNIYVFGDNKERKGRAGQACVRYEPNSYGIITKLYPSLDDGAFLEDKKEHWNLIKYDLENLYNRAKNQDLTIIFPADGLGTGLAKMSEKSPNLFKAMNRTIKDLFDVKIPL